MAWNLGLLGAALAAPVGAYELLETQILTGNQATITFSNLNSSYGSTYQHLQIRATQRSSVADNGAQAVLSFNSDTNVNSYAMHQLFGNGSSVQTEAVTSGFLGGIAPVGRIPGANATANSFGGVIIDILDPFETTKNTILRALSGSPSTEARINFVSGVWLNTAAVTTITLQPQGGGNFVQYSRFSLYGLRSS
jgi:hypothetical protein